MNDRTNDLLKARPQISSKTIQKNMSFEEKFQNETIRPIVKLQKDLIVAAFQNYLNKHKSAFYDLSVEKKELFITSAIQKDIKFRNSLKGMIIGQFTLDEYKLYIEASSQLNKRMMKLVTERLKDNLLLFENKGSILIKD